MRGTLDLMFWVCSYQLKSGGEVEINSVTCTVLIVASENAGFLGYGNSLLSVCWCFWCVVTVCDVYSCLEELYWEIFNR